MAKVNPYLIFNGNCEDAFLFYKSVFDTDFSQISKFGDMPPVEGQVLSESDKNRVMHVSLPIGNDSFLFGSDANSMSGDVKMGENISISIDANSKEEADKLFNGLSDGGVIKMPITTTFWNAYFGMFEDKFGIHWMVNFDFPTE